MSVAQDRKLAPLWPELTIPSGGGCTALDVPSARDAEGQPAGIWRAAGSRRLSAPWAAQCNTAPAGWPRPEPRHDRIHPPNICLRTVTPLRRSNPTCGSCCSCSTRVWRISGSARVERRGQWLTETVEEITGSLTGSRRDVAQTRRPVKRSYDPVQAGVCFDRSRLALTSSFARWGAAPLAAIRVTVPPWPGRVARPTERLGAGRKCEARLQTATRAHRVPVTVADVRCCHRRRRAIDAAANRNHARSRWLRGSRATQRGRCPSILP